MAQADDHRDKRELEFDESNFVLYELAPGQLELQVVANQSACYYFIIHRLSAAEVDAYTRRGKAVLIGLANRVRSDERRIR